RHVAGGAGIRDGPVHGRRSARADYRTARQRQSPDRRLPGLPVPVLQAGVLRLQADSREIRGAAAGRREVRPQGLPARLRVQRERPGRRPAPLGVRGGGGRASRHPARQGRGDGGVAVSESADAHPAGRPPGCARCRGRQRLRVALSVHSHAGERRRRHRPPARRPVDADALHQRREIRRRAAAAVLRSGDRLRAEARNRKVNGAALATFDLTKDFAVGFWRKRPYRALDRLTIQVAPGEVFGFLGPNGAGKTTTLKLLMQLVYPTSGRAELLGRPLGDLDVKRRIGYLPENPYFYDHLTAEELLKYFAALFGYSPAE